MIWKCRKIIVYFYAVKAALHVVQIFQTVKVSMTMAGVRRWTHNRVQTVHEGRGLPTVLYVELLVSVWWHLFDKNTRMRVVNLSHGISLRRPYVSTIYYRTVSVRWITVFNGKISPIYRNFSVKLPLCSCQCSWNMTTNMHAAETNGGSDANWKDSYKTAQMITLPDVTRICGEQAGQLVQELAQGVGCPEEFILFPLLSCCSGDWK